LNVSGKKLDHRFQGLVGKVGVSVMSRRALAGLVASGLALSQLAVSGLAAPALANDKKRIVGFGDSLMAGYGLPAGDSFPAQLQAALDAKGLAISIENAGVSGDTTTGGLDRLDWAIGEGIAGVILELGANDALRGIAPEVTEKNLDDMLTRLKARNIPVLLAGMRSPPNNGTAYQAAFDSMFERLAQKHGATLYPFFLDGVVADARLNQADGIHPNKEGVAVIVARMLPTIERWIASLK
jgi:acyl-CoA thioesterase I